MREASPIELALLFESSKEEIVKKPDLELLLVDSEGNATKSITASPVFTKVKKIKVEMPPTPFSTSFETIKNLSSLASLYPFAEKEPVKDFLVRALPESHTKPSKDPSATRAKRSK